MDAVDIGKLTPQEEAAALGVNISVRDVSRPALVFVKVLFFFNS